MLVTVKEEIIKDWDLVEIDGSVKVLQHKETPYLTLRIWSETEVELENSSEDTYSIWFDNILSAVRSAKCIIDGATIVRGSYQTINDIIGIYGTDIYQDPDFTIDIGVKGYPDMDGEPIFEYTFRDCVNGVEYPISDDEDLEVFYVEHSEMFNR